MAKAIAMSLAEWRRARFTLLREFARAGGRLAAVMALRRLLGFIKASDA